ncbi:MAG: glycogen-debranching protein [Cyanobacteria bacterium HKST-UBA01]|nr:glycogen-debranching protein [Cyanobacteria bacterium HKST-UBA01]
MNTKQKKRSFITSPGLAEPLGATVVEGGVNFAVFSTGATEGKLHVFKSAPDTDAEAVLPMHRSGSVYHLHVDGLDDGALYLFSLDGPSSPYQGERYDKGVMLFDPYARMLTGTTGWVAPSLETSDVVAKCVVVKEGQFDWEDDRKPNTPLVESIVYEVHLRGFTAHSSSPVTSKRGSYKAFAEMIPYLTELGVTAVELMPIMEWYRPTRFVNPFTGKANKNDWGYDTLAFMAPDEGLASVRGKQNQEFKALVRALHKAGIEVILDIVVNHSAESDATGPTISFRGLDNKVYYLLLPDNKAEYANFTGCGNTVNVNHPEVRKLLLKVFRTWVEEYHVDGFRFDLGAVLGIDTDLVCKPDAPLLKEIVADPILSKVKLIAEPWAIGAYLMGRFPAPFAEWSDRFRDTVRGFVRAEAGMVKEMMAVISGSTDMFGAAGEKLPVNFFTAHDGFTAMDLVSYEQKRNLANGENNRDGSDHNRSWNCGYEGDLVSSGLSDEDKSNIERLRKRQIKNFYTLAMLSRGVPMILFGDEMGRSNKGNNNSWNQEELNDLDWSLLESNGDLRDFVSAMIGFRKAHKLGGKGHNPVFRPVHWHGTKPNSPDASDGARFLSFELKPFEGEAGQAVYCAANAYWEPLEVTLPDGEWSRIVDTSADAGEDLVKEQQAEVVSGAVVIQARSTLVFLKTSS